MKCFVKTICVVSSFHLTIECTLKKKNQFVYNASISELTCEGFLVVCVKTNRSDFELSLYIIIQEIFGRLLHCLLFSQRTKYRTKACRLFIALRVFVPIASNTHHTFSSYNVDSNDDGR